jgi:hypothetical protein
LQHLLGLSSKVCGIHGSSSKPHLFNSHARLEKYERTDKPQPVFHFSVLSKLDLLGTPSWDVCTMKTRGITIVELLCTVVILTILTSLLTPIFAKAKLDSKSNSAKLNLRNFWTGIKLYQESNDGAGSYGEPSEMGLPPDEVSFGAFVNNFTNDFHHTWETKSQFLPCGKSVGEDDFEGLGYMPMVKNDWLSEVQKRRDRTVLIYDKNCNVPGTRVMCQFCDKRSIGITLNGELRDRRNTDWKVYDQHFYQ